jgi:oligopeptide transport system ATP-binding protein
MDSIISVRELTKHFPVKAGITRKTIGWVKVVDGIDFDIQKGETYSLIGESGCGKTTTARLILLLHDPTSGSILFNGEKILVTNKAMIREYR